MSTNSHGEIEREMGRTDVQKRASGVAAEIRRLGEEAFRYGCQIRDEAERFAQEEEKAVADMAAHLRKGISRLQHIEQIMRNAQSPEPPPLPIVNMLDEGMAEIIESEEADIRQPHEQ